jgi:hypothetical protein
MITGRDTLSQLQRALQDEQKRTRALDAQMSKANDRLLQLDATRSKELQQLARLRLQHLGGGAIEQRLDDADRQVMALLEERTADYNALQQRLTALERQRDDLERERDAAAEAVERAAKSIDDAEAATQARLRADPEYQRALQRARDAERVAVHADEKATLSEQEQDAKGKAYRDDPLFMYLWKRRYGTSEYRAGGGPFAPLLRWLDGKVARLIGYADARPNYARLLEIPLRLREHAEYVGAVADAELEELTRRDAQGRIDDGIPRLEAQRDEAQQALDEVEARITALAEDYQALLARLEQFAKGEDERFQQAVAFLTSELGREDLQSLRHDALATPFPQDDVIVARLLDLESERERTAATVAELKQTAERNRGRVRDLETLRKEFTQRQYDAPGSNFPDGAVIATLLGQFLSGLLTRDTLWRVLEQQRRYTPPRSDPTFGSGSFGRGTIWGGSQSTRRRTTADDIGSAIETVGKVLEGLGGLSSSGRGSFGGTRRASSNTRTSGGVKRSTGTKAAPRTGKIGGGKFRTGGKF